MTGTEIKTLFETLVDDSTVDSTTAFQLMNIAKNEVEAERPWEMLKAVDTASSTASGDTYATAKSLPTDFGTSLELYVGDDTIPYMQIPFDQKEKFKNIDRRWFIDMANSNFHLCGTQTETKTLRLFYIKATDDIAAGTSPVWPTRFHGIIAYKMAELFYALEAGEKGRSWDDRWSRNYQMLKDQMIYWDANLKIDAAQNATLNQDYSYHDDIVT